MNFVFLCCAVAAIHLSVSGQSNVSGRFFGVVRDRATHAVIPDATATFKNLRTGSLTTARSGSDGQFSYTPLPPDDYEIEVKADGYLPQMQRQILTAMQPTPVEPIPFELIKETIAANATPVPPTTDNTNLQPTPTPAPPRTETESISLNPSRGAVFDIRAVLGLPLGGTTLTRSFDELAFLVPGVYLPPQAIGNTVGPGIGGGVGTSGQFSVNGLRSRANNFTVDGSDNNDEDIGVRRQGFFTLVPQPIESIQEFQIVTLLAPAQYGRNLGAQVNAVSKGGGNDFHGIIYGLGNADFLNARNTFDTVGGIAPFKLTGINPNGVVPVRIDGVQPTITSDAGDKDTFSLLQGGFAVGGPVLRNKLFFFASGEFQNLDGFRERSFAVPTVAQRGFAGSGASGLIQGAADSLHPGYPTAFNADAVFSLFPFPNNPRGVYGVNTFTQELPIDARGRVLSGRADYNLFRSSNKPQTLTVRYNNTDDRRDLTDVGGALFSAIQPKVRTDNLSAYLTGPLARNLSNEFRFSWGRTRLDFKELEDGSGFLLPVDTAQIGNADDSRFLLNARLLQNNTLPTQDTSGNFFAPSVANYLTSGNTAASSLGPIGQLVVSGFSPVGVDVFNFPQKRENNTFQFADTLHWQFNGGGSHSLSAGTDIRRTFLFSDLPRNSRPLVTFNGSPDFLAFCGVFPNRPECTEFPPTQDACVGSLFCSGSDLASAGAATGFFQSLVLPGSDASIDLSYYQLNFFAQDEWRVRRNLSLNFGLRYEYNTTPKEADRKIENTFGQQPYPFLTGLSSFIEGRKSIYDGDRNNFAPRIGFAWAPSSSTVIRGGYGMYFDQILGSVVSQSRNVLPTFSTANFGGGVLIDNSDANGFAFTLFNPINAIFDPAQGIVCNALDLAPACGPNSIPLVRQGTLNTINSALSSQQIRTALGDIFGLFPFSSVDDPNNPTGSSFSITLPTRKLDTPFSHQYSIGIEQRLFGSGMFVSAAYVGTTGRNLLRFTTPNLGSNFISLFERFDLDRETFDLLVHGFTLDPVSGRPTAGFGPVFRFQTTGRSQYNSMQFALRGRFLNRTLQYRLGYVYGKVNDDVSDVFDLAGAFALPQNSRTFDGEYAPANFDVRHRFTYSFIYDLPQMKDQAAVTRFLIGGWKIAGTGKFGTGQPFTVNSTFDVNLDGNLTDRLNNTQFITKTGDRSQPLSLTCSGTQCQQMLAQIGRDGSVNRNSFRSGSVLELDMSFAKQFKFRESHDIEFRADVFNFINRANFGIPVRLLEFPGFGRAVDTVTPGRRIQLMVRYIF